MWCCFRFCSSLDWEKSAKKPRLETPSPFSVTNISINCETTFTDNTNEKQSETWDQPTPMEKEPPLEYNKDLVVSLQHHKSGLDEERHLGREQPKQLDDTPPETVVSDTEKDMKHFESDASTFDMFPNFEEPVIPKFHLNPHVAREWQPAQPHLMRPDARIDTNRRFHAVKSSPYNLPADILEQDRLELSHALYRYCSGGLFNMPIEELLEAGGAKVLDIGCGPGSWTRDVALTYPNAEVHGLDMAKTLYDGVEVPPNVHFDKGDILQQLPYPDNTFDAVFQRNLIFAIPAGKWKHVILEIKRVLKPGGFMELIEPCPGLENIGPYFDEFGRCMYHAFEARGVNMTIALILSQLICESGIQVVQETVFSSPIGWGGRHGELNKINFRGFYAGLKPFLMKALDLTSPEYDEAVEQCLEECVRYETYQNALSVVGRVLGK